ncbi:uncharacterized protein EI90DRAFT_2661173 [Cantharellus anzutake]|uniref:uncharacterized protein n=1 Tax=Cantharellus anzutake TaxID=1750568 RepID=UPI00190851F2|nr:uncharacterized protein EI90DRAFT_2661173 [Cantharellus anzutake]KAF8337530.1 hypothetical protein EI90DRAFT_2661173 [Cantharellus anzutake]
MDACCQRLIRTRVRTVFQPQLPTPLGVELVGQQWRNPQSLHSVNHCKSYCITIVIITILSRSVFCPGLDSIRCTMSHHYRSQPISPRAYYRNAPPQDHPTKASASWGGTSTFSQDQAYGQEFAVDKDAKCPGRSNMTKYPSQETLNPDRRRIARLDGFSYSARKPQEADHRLCETSACTSQTTTRKPIHDRYTYPLLIEAYWEPLVCFDTS